jgi:putrescine aminotransferase
MAELLAHKTAAAVVFEAIQGEGGIHELPADYLRFLQDRCRATGTLLIADEVQTGVGRTGDFFGFEASGIRPDVIAMAKSLSGGLIPVGAVIAREEPFQRAFGSLRYAFDSESTFGGGALAMAAAYATIQTLQSERLAARAAELGGRLIAGLRQSLRGHPLVRAIRGRGLMIGIDFQPLPWPIPQIAQEGSRALLAQFISIELIREHGIIAQVAGLDPGVLKITPPLITPADELDRIPKALETILTSLTHPRALLALAARTAEAMA